MTFEGAKAGGRREPDVVSKGTLRRGENLSISLGILWVPGGAMDIELYIYILYIYIIYYIYYIICYIIYIYIIFIIFIIYFV